MSAAERARRSGGKQVKRYTQDAAKRGVADGGRLTGRVLEAIALKSPEVWLDGTRRAVSQLRVVLKPWVKANYFDRRKVGKVHVFFNVAGSEVQLVLDDNGPPGLQMVVVDGISAMKIGKLHVAPSGHVYVEATLQIPKTRRGEGYKMYAHVLGVRIDKPAEDDTAGDGTYEIEAPY